MKAEHPPEPDLPYLLQKLPHLRLGPRRRYIPYHRRVIAIIFLALLAYYNVKPYLGFVSPPPRYVDSPCDSPFWGPRLKTYCGSPGALELVETVDDDDREPLQVFEVASPAVAAGTPVVYETELMQHTFGWSYGRPFVGAYAPPPRNISWSKAVFNLTMTSRGRQFDRLAHVFLGDVEVWRTSTAEPTRSGIVFSREREMTGFSALLREEQKLIFEMGNLVDDTYTGSFNATLVARFYDPEILDPDVRAPADGILPVSAMRSGEDKPSHWSLPGDTATSRVLQRLPKNTIKAHISISASGNGNEEFWYTNVATSYHDFFPNTTLPGFGPWREIQVLLDTELVGVAWPYPVVFTGGIVPSLWRPIVGIGTFDLPTYTLDLSAFLPQILSARARPTITLRVVTYDDATRSVSSSIGQDWLVSARLLYWTDADPAWTTTGSLHSLVARPPVFTFSAPPEGNSTLSLSLTASRSIVALATLRTSAGPRRVSCIQNLNYVSRTVLSERGYAQTLHTTTSVSGQPGPAMSFSLDLRSRFVEREDGGFGLSAVIAQGLETGGKVVGLRGDAEWVSGAGGRGRTGVEYSERRVRRRDGGDVRGYARRVTAEGDRVVDDWERVE